MRKFCCLIIAFVLALSAVSAQAVSVRWSEQTVKEGEMTATVKGVEAGDRIVVEILSGGVFSGLNMVWAEGDSAEVPVQIQSGDDTVRVFVWEQSSMRPRVSSADASVITTNGIKDESAIFSDNQIVNNSAAVGYKNIDTVTGVYSISFDLTVYSKGDNAIMLGDSANGNIGYGESSALLLFNGDSFVVRPGNGQGSYSSDAVTLCPVELGKTYGVVFQGNTETNTFNVIISDGENEYMSETMTARRNAVNGIDTIAFVSNGRNTTVFDGYCSDFAFVGHGLSITDEYTKVLPMYPYEGFEGLYYGLKVGDRYVRGNSGLLTADYTEISDTSAMFLPRDMGDGSHAIVCRSSNNRMTTPASTGLSLTSAGYVPTDNSQHWVLEESENYSESKLSYYIKSLDNGYYVGKSSTGTSLVLTSESEKVEVVFVPLEEESLLYSVSQTNVYNLLTDAQRERLETVYETVAGDMFGRYGGYSEWTPRIRMDNMFAEILSGNLTEGEQYALLTEFLNATNGFIYSGQASYQTISTSLPGTEGVYFGIDEGVAGNYDFWRGTMLDGMLYVLTIYNADGSVQQTINLYVEDQSTAQTNAETFKSIIVQIPYEFRQHLKTVKIRNDGANSYNGGGNDMYIRLNWTPDANSMRSTVVHELGHIIDSQNGYWASGAGWAAAIASDMYTPSTYGASNATEDFAEFCRMYFACYNNPDMQKALQIIMPARYASFGRLRMNNMAGWGLWEDEYTS